VTDRTVVYRLRAEAAQFRAEVAGAGAAVRKAAGDMAAANVDGEKYRRGLTTVGDTAGKVGLVAAGSLATMAKAAIDWESAWAGVTKTVDGSASQMAELEEGLRDLAKTMPATHEEIAGVAEAAGQLGVSREDILSFTKTMIDLGETTNLTAEAAATNIAQIANVMGTTGDEIDNFGAALVALGNDGASTEAQILDMTQRIAGAGAQIGLAETDILAIANAAASMGIEAEAGGSAISRVFTELAKATSSGGPKLEQFAEIAGMTAEQFVTAFGDDPAQAFQAFTEGLDRVNKSGGDVFTTLKQVGLSDIRVSQALLGMAASGDLLADSLALGKTAWDENTALAMEAAKRYDTTASEIQVSWNRIKDAGIEAGEALLPVVAGVAETVGSLADSFGALPDPVQNSLTGLLGITAVFGGGLWFTSKVVNGVADMKGALDDLGFSGDKTAGSLGRVGQAAAIAGATLASMAIVDQLQRQFEGLDTGLEGITGQLIELSETDGGKLSGEFDNIADSFDRLTDPNKAQAFQDSIYDTMGFLGSDSRVDEAVAQFEALDTALTNLVATGGVETADTAFDSLAESMGLNADEQKELLKLFPQYQDAMAGAENQSKLNTDTAEEQAAATESVAAAMTAAEEAAEDFKDLMESLNAVLSGRGEMRDYEAAIDDFTKTLKENGNTFDINTEKGRENQAMLDNIASSALAVADEMSQADRRKFLTQAIKDLRTMGAEMGLPKSEVKALIELLRTANKADVNPNIDANTGPALGKIAALEAKLRAIKDEDVFVNIREIKTTSLGPRIENANGSVLDFYANGGMRENHVAQIAPAGAWRVWAEPETGGEAYIPLAPSKRERSIDIWEEVGARLGVEFQQFANGGTSDKRKRKRRTSLEFDSVVDNSPTEAALQQAAEAAEAFYAEQDRALREAEDRAKREAEIAEAVFEGQQRAWDMATDAAQAQVDAAEAMVDSVQASMDRIGQAATSAFSGSWFTGGQDHGMWVGGGAGDWRSRAEADIAGLEERSSLITQLSGLGLAGAALEDLLGNQSNRGIAAMIQAGEIDDFAAFFAQREALMTTVQQQAGQAGYGADYAAASQQLVLTNQKLDLLNALIAQARPINVTETVSAAALAAEVARLQALWGGF
jgi:TP901 family phage tail tape measure protein